MRNCRRFCSCHCTSVQQRSTTSCSALPTSTTPIACDLHDSIGFNNRRNLVRDQGVGGSNPLSPTKLFGFSSKIPLSMRSEYPPLQRPQGWAASFVVIHRVRNRKGGPAPDKT
jgi:hypothetical protein